MCRGQVLTDLKQWSFFRAAGRSTVTLERIWALPNKVKMCVPYKHLLDIESTQMYTYTQ